MTAEDRPIVEAFARIAELAAALGVTRIGDLPGLWEYRVDERWFIAVNGHNWEIPYQESISMPSMPVPPFHAYIEFNGWPAGFASPYGGTIAAGSVANEDTFIEAVKAAIRKAGKKPT